MNSSKRPAFGPRKIAILAIVLLIAGYQWYVRPAADPNANATTSSSDADATKPKSEFFKTSGTRLESPEGLIYAQGPRGEHRTEHVLRHASDIPNRDGPHGVFDAKGDDVFRLIDEAYSLVRKRPASVKTTQQDRKTVYVIDLGRKIGFKGGKSGKAQNHPPLSKIKLVLDRKRVITAYPY